MIGGPPIVQPYPQYQYLPPPVPRKAPTPASGVASAARAPSAPVVRGQKPDDVPSRPVAAKPLEMPSPESLGVPVPAAPVDWTDVRLKLDRLGATGFTLDTLPGGGYRFACRVPLAAGQTRTVEGRAATEAEAVRRALEQAAGR